MCSIQEDEPLPRDSRPNLRSHPQKCMKCDKPAVTIARTKDPFCSDCFCTYFLQRFRTILGKSRILKPGEKVLLAFSGGPSSRVLLQLIEHSTSERAGKRLRIIPSVLFIDEGALLKQNKEERCSCVIETLSIARDCGLDSFFVPLEQVFSPVSEVYRVFSPACDQQSLNDRVLSSLCQYEDGPLSQLLTVLDSFQSSTARENFLLTLRQRLITDVAKRNGFTKVLMGDNATNVSVRLLSNVAQGRGAAIPLDTGLLDDRNEDIPLVRPLREYPESEVRDYLALRNLKVVKTPPPQEVHRSVSVEGAAASFVRGLMENFPSTVNTIFRTGEKLSVQAGENFCDLCQAPLVEVPDESVFEHLPQNTGALCYGCKLTVKDMKDGSVDYLPCDGARNKH